MTTLSEAGDTIARLVVEALADGDWIDGPVDPIQYHGAPPDEVDETGECVGARVSWWWDTLGGSDRFPSPAPVAECGGPPLVALTVRWTDCWPIEPAWVPAMSAVAHDFTEGGWSVWTRLLLLACRSEPVLPDDRRSRLALLSMDIRRPKGGVAGVDFKLRLKASIDGAPSGS